MKSMINNSAHNKKISLAEFKHATLSHQKRVFQLGLVLFDQFTADFSNVQSHQVSGFLKIHDYAKTEILSDGTEQIGLLYQFYGMNKTDLQDQERFKFLSAINHINYLDSQYALQFFQSQQLINSSGEFSSAAHELLLIEKIADLVDRGENQMSSDEFNKKLKKASAIIENEKWAHYAHFLENHYQQIISIRSAV